MPYHLTDDIIFDTIQFILEKPMWFHFKNLLYVTSESSMYKVKELTRKYLKSEDLKEIQSNVCAENIQ